MDDDIEKGVPLPPSARAGQASYAWLRRMEPGDSKAVPKRFRGSLSTAIRRQKWRQPEQDFAVRTLGDEIRVWRTA